MNVDRKWSGRNLPAGDKLRKLVKKWNIPVLWIPALCAFLCLCGGENGRFVFLGAVTVLFAVLYFVTMHLRKPEDARLPAPDRRAEGEFRISELCGLACLVFGLCAMTHLPMFSVLRDLTCTFGVVLGLSRVEAHMAADSFALNVHMLRNEEVLEQNDDPYPLGNVDLVVIDPDIFAKNDLLPPKFYYCGALRHAGSMDARDQRYLLQAVIGCAGEGSVPANFTELIVKNRPNEAAFHVLDTSEENGLVLSRQQFREATLTFAKGTCEAISSNCDSVSYNGIFAPLSDEERDRIREACAEMRNRGCRVFAYSMYTPGVKTPVFLGMVGFGTSREADLRSTMEAMHAAGVEVCFAGTGSRETVFGIAESCGITVTRFMTGRELSGRVVPPSAHEIASHRLFAELTKEHQRSLLDAFYADGYHPVAIGTKEIRGIDGAVRAAFSGKESCEKLLLCLKMRRSAERSARGFAASRRVLGLAAVALPTLAGIFTQSFACPVLPVIAVSFALFAWISALCCGLMFKNSETPRDMGADRRRSNRKNLFADITWAATLVAICIPVITVPLLAADRKEIGISLSAATLLISASPLVFSYVCGISLRPEGVFRKHPAAYVCMICAAALTILAFSIGHLSEALGFATVGVSDWRMSLPFAVVPLLVLGIFLFIEWVIRPEEKH